MSKIKKPVPTDKIAVIPSVKVGDVTIYNVPASSKKLLKKLGAVTAMLSLVLLTKGLLLIKAGAAKFSLLYLIGDNGLKSGRASGNVYLRNGRVRQFRVPRLVRNAYTATVRATFALYSGNFRGLTVDEIAAWNAYKGTASDRFGRIIEITGKQAYVRLNALLASIGSLGIGLPPTGMAAPSPTLNPDITVNTGVALSINYTTQPEGGTTQLWATAPLSAGVTRPGQSKFVQIGVIDTSVSGPASIIGAYTLRFGTPISGAQIFIQLKVVDGATGLPSAITQSLGSVTT